MTHRTTTIQSRLDHRLASRARGKKINQYIRPIFSKQNKNLQSNTSTQPPPTTTTIQTWETRKWRQRERQLLCPTDTGSMYDMPTQEKHRQPLRGILQQPRTEITQRRRYSNKNKKKKRLASQDTYMLTRAKSREKYERERKKPADCPLCNLLDKSELSPFKIV